MDANDSEAFTVDKSPQPYYTVESTATDYKKEKDYESNSEAADSRLIQHRRGILILPQKGTSANPFRS